MSSLKDFGLEIYKKITEISDKEEYKHLPVNGVTTMIITAALACARELVDDISPNIVLAIRSCPHKSALIKAIYKNLFSEN